MDSLYTKEELIKIRNYLLNRIEEYDKIKKEPFNLKVKETGFQWLICEILDKNRSYSFKEWDSVNIENNPGKIDSLSGNEIRLLMERPITFKQGNTVHLFPDQFFISLIESQLDLLNNLIAQSDSVRDLVKLVNFNYTPPLCSQSLKHDTNLNQEQNDFVRKTIGLFDSDSSKFYLCWGPGGTGKTKCIVEIVKWCVENKKRVLITSFTNIAVENALEKLIEAGLGDYVVSTAPRSRIKTTQVRSFSYEEKFSCMPDIRFKKIAENIGTCLIVGSTLDTIGFDTKHLSFDLAILDESSMIEFPSALLAISKAEKFVMIGDPEQLGPLQKVYDESFSSSLSVEELRNLFGFFNRLIRRGGPSFYTQLELQYRSQKSVVDFSSNRVYDHKLRSFKNKEETFEKIRDTPYFKTLGDHLLKNIFDPKFGFVWLDTSNFEENHWLADLCYRCGAELNWNGKNKTRYCPNYQCNTQGRGLFAVPAEIYLTVAVLKYLLDILRILHPSDDSLFDKIGILAPFNKQVALIRDTILSCQLLKPYIDREMEIKRKKLNSAPTVSKREAISELEIGTVHRFQGKEKEFIILSTVYESTSSLQPFETHGLLNVALTRAKLKTIVLGNSQQFSKNYQVRRLSKILNSSQKIDSEVDLNDLYAYAKDNELIFELDPKLIYNNKELDYKKIISKIKFLPNLGGEE